MKEISLWFCICFVCFLIRTLFNLLNFRHMKIAENKILISAIYVVMGTLWFSWFQMCFAETVKVSIPLWLRYLGLAGFIVGVLLFIFSHIKMKGFSDKDGLVTRGIYSKIRNPMYLGFVIWIIGFPVFLQKILTLFSSIIWIIHILIWKILEEKELEGKYPKYSEYKKKTWF